MPYYESFMVDLETTGTKPNLNHVVEISIVGFNLDTRERDVGISVNLSKEQAGRGADQSTLSWWANSVSREVRERVFKNFLNPEINNADELNKILDYVLYSKSPYKKEAIMWAKPIHFDYMFLSSIFRENEVAMPFNYWSTIDMWSYCSALLNFDTEMYNSLKPERPDAHSSLADIHWQLDWLFKVKDYADAKSKD